MVEKTRDHFRPPVRWMDIRSFDLLNMPEVPKQLRLIKNAFVLLAGTFARYLCLLHPFRYFRFYCVKVETPAALHTRSSC